jgi:hypothetical protein
MGNFSFHQIGGHSQLNQLTLQPVDVNPRLHDYSTAVIVESNQHTEKLIQACIELLKSRLGQSEVASARLFKSWVERNQNPEKATYTISAVLDPTGRLVAMASGSVTPAGLLLVGYTVSAADCAGLGLGTTAYGSLVRAAHYICKHEFETPLRLQVVEASHGAEDFWRRQGFGEVMLTGGDNSPQKLLYLQPPLAWDRMTGEPESPAQYRDTKKIVAGDRVVAFPGVYEELMIKPMEPRAAGCISAETVLEVIHALYREYYFLKRSVDPSAFDRYFGYFNALMETYRAEVESAHSISLQ